MATPTSPHTGARGAARFVLTVAVIHVVTYVLAGLVASTVFDYEAIFTEPVIRDYYLPYASTDPFWSIGLQVLRPGRGARLGGLSLRTAVAHPAGPHLAGHDETQEAARARPLHCGAGTRVIPQGEERATLSS